MGNGVFATDLKMYRSICIGATKIHIGATAWVGGGHREGEGGPDQREHSQKS